MENFNGLFWLEKNDNEYELHVEFEVDIMRLDVKEKLISISTSGKNEAAKGIMEKIRSVAETMLLAIFEPGTTFQTPYYDINMGILYEDPYLLGDNSYMYAWSLCNYKNNVIKEEKRESLDELEHSIVANLADDILVGIKGKNVEIVVKKSI